MEPRVLIHEVKGDGERVVLVPGGLTGWVSWVPHAERLSASYRTIRVQPIHNELGSISPPSSTSRVSSHRNATVLELPGDHACHIQSIDAFLAAFEGHLAVGRPS
jgi:hypothetical protein